MEFPFQIIAKYNIQVQKRNQMTPKWYVEEFGLSRFRRLKRFASELTGIQFPLQIIPKYNIHVRKRNEITPKWYLLKNLDLADFVDLADCFGIYRNGISASNITKTQNTSPET